MKFCHWLKLVASNWSKICLKLRQRPIKLIWLQNLVLEKVRVAKLSAILLLILGKG